ncbi:hypothetical protein EJ04DRAFT_567835 [Polyplosphaeria fusca]|uniref:Uncharacterized protein n=1 Tax=Polyplosphaeria fusca TaxID=682080 RepID=A0A9P4UXG9_9PLEO|nr:hypothetical protein EJ04DRAFT_567835 [Polyplosphaeria fusca]
MAMVPSHPPSPTPKFKDISQPTSPLFRIPREIRDMIYSLASTHSEPLAFFDAFDPQSSYAVGPIVQANPALYIHHTDISLSSHANLSRTYTRFSNPLAHTCRLAHAETRARALELKHTTLVFREERRVLDDEFLLWDFSPHVEHIPPLTSFLNLSALLSAQNFSMLRDVVLYDAAHTAIRGHFPAHSVEDILSVVACAQRNPRISFRYVISCFRDRTFYSTWQAADNVLRYLFGRDVMVLLRVGDAVRMEHLRRVARENAERWRGEEGGGDFG